MLQSNNLTGFGVGVPTLFPPIGPAIVLNDSQDPLGTGVLQPGMMIVAMGGCYNGGGSTPVVEIPPGWSNLAFAVNSTSPREATGIWCKRVMASETPNFFTNHSNAQIHFYGLPGDVTLERLDWQASSSPTGNPSATSVDASGVGGPFYVFACYHSDASASAINTDIVTYNGGDQVQVRTAQSNTNNYLVSRFNYEETPNGLSGLSAITFDMGDHGGANGYCAAVCYRRGPF